ncbi:MAG TPA: START domain-containing protein [Oligoflexus sp.]|uniref:START domain-containing protein n=1 Tax=Oligoflexus sp. TaxID=1971216 RepID=UPI002D5ED5C7|nr:START domain-containing protein [Oligoflexus sp.]HYX39036.1 START domain-containing protein [Oligoflexus sp.]
MRRFTLLLSITLSGFVGSPLAVAKAPAVDKGWEVLNTEEGVTVYRSDKAQDNIFTFRGVGLVESSIPKLIALMSDPHRMPEWVFNCEEGQLVERNFKDSDRAPDASPYYQIFYGVTSVPWPLTPRDYVLKAQISYEKLPNSSLPKNVTIAMRSIEHPKKPEVPGRVRMPVMESMIVMTPEDQEGKKTWVDFSVTTNPGGVIPAWISQMASRDIPRKTLVNLRKLAQKQDYNKEFEELVNFHYVQNLKK